MSSDLLWLKPNVQVEPLVDQWYAWSHLIPPATAARNIACRHLKIMDSYINSPQVHANAVKNPKMAGGPFIDYGGKRVDEINRLRDETRRKRAGLLQLSSALEELDIALRAGPKGLSLKSIYPKVPEPLKGLVELVYDLNHNPSFRLIEPLLYSKYHDRSAQSLMLSLTHGDDRAFVLSTPRLEDERSVHLRTPFDHESVDRLFRTKNSPQPWGAICEIAAAPPKQRETLRTMFTDKPPRPYQPYTGTGVRWRYFGHACILIETPGMSVLVDPVISYSYKSEVPRYTFSDLPDRIDYALITHNHQDHVLFETLLQIRDKVGAIVAPRGGGTFQDPLMKLMLQNIGFKRVIELGEMETMETPDGSITGIPFIGEHAELEIRSKLAYLVRIKGNTLLFAADSCNLDPMLYERVCDQTGSVDTLFLGMECDGAPLSWLYGPLLMRKVDRSVDESRRLSGSDSEQALDMVNRFKCKNVYIYAMGMEPWLNYVMGLKYTEESQPIVESNRLIQICRENGVYAERLFGKKEVIL